MTKWGLCATVLAPPRDILRFVAFHLDQGAHRIFMYLDADTPAAHDALKAHPKVRTQTCDTAYWNRLGKTRPDKHQARQSVNATHAYHRRTEVDWLIHMDVDEFLVAKVPVATVLAQQAPIVTSARVRPMELLGGSAQAFKAFIPPTRTRQTLVAQIYPTYGTHLRGGFLSHLAGKLFVRTGLSDITVQIHNAFQRGEMLARASELADIDLAHAHAKSWEDWRRAYAYRLDKGSYRSDLKPAPGGLRLHDLFRQIEAEQGEQGLRAFYDEAIGDSADMRARLDAHGLLRIVDLDLDGAVARHFPGTAI